MEPITHFLTGACLSRAGLNRRTGLATLTLVLASETPDLDIVSALGGSVSYLQHHRGITHTLLGAPFVAAGTLALVFALDRFFLSRRRKPRLAPKWRLLYLYALLAVLVHLFMDFTNSYGVRPFEPFNWKWYSWDIVFIIDPILLAVLLLGIFVPVLFGLISEEIGERKAPRGRGGAIFALVFFVIFIYVRDFEHRRAVNLLNSVTHGDQLPVRSSAYSTYWNPFEWYGVVETQDFLRSVVVYPRQGQLDEETARISYKPAETQVTLAAKKSRLGRAYLDWAQYPVVTEDSMPGVGYKVQFTDLRFARISDERAPAILTGYVILDPKLDVVDVYVGNPRKP